MVNYNKFKRKENKREYLDEGRQIKDNQLIHRKLLEGVKERKLENL